MKDNKIITIIIVYDNNISSNTFTTECRFQKRREKQESGYHCSLDNRKFVVTRRVVMTAHKQSTVYTRQQGRVSLGTCVSVCVRVCVCVCVGHASIATCVS